MASLKNLNTWMASPTFLLSRPALNASAQLLRRVEEVWTRLGDGMYWLGHAQAIRNRMCFFFKSSNDSWYDGEFRIRLAKMVEAVVLKLGKEGGNES